MTFKTPYETTACYGHDAIVKSTVAQVKQALITGDLKQASTPKGVPLKGIYTIPSYFKGIEPFYHPLVVEFRGEQVVVVDSRSSLRTVANTGEQVISNRMEYAFLIARAALVYKWINGDAAALAQNSDLPLQVFTGWVPQAIVRNKNLDPHHQQTLVALSGLWFLSQFTDEDLTSEGARLRAAARIARLTRVPAERIMEITDGLGRLLTIDDFVKAVRERVDSPRVSDMTAGLLISYIKSAWFGAAAQEISAVALEYPPYFLAMVYTSVDDRSYKNTRLTQLVDIYDRNGAGRQYALTLTRMMQELSQ